MRFAPQAGSNAFIGVRDLQELVSRLSIQFGIEEKIIRKAAGMILSLLQKVGDRDAVAELFDKVPDAYELAARESETANSSIGLLGVLGDLAGGSTGEIMSTFSALQSEGLSIDQIKTLGTGLLDHARDSAGDELVDRVIEGVPGIKQYL